MLNAVKSQVNRIPESVRVGLALFTTIVLLSLIHI